MIYWTDFDFNRYRKTSATYRRDHKYSEHIAAFDLETTNYKNMFAFMYIWQLGIDDQIAYGRTWSELREFLAEIKQELCLNYSHKLIVMDHNLKYDFGFFCREIPIDGEIIAKSRHEILMCTVFDCFEWRDSLNYSEKSLDNMGEEIGIPKVKGYDYTKLRHQNTALDDAELRYCERDVEILMHYFKRESDKYGNIGKVPLTATQRVKRLMSQRMAASDNQSKIMMGMIKKRQLNPDVPFDNMVLKFLRIAFFGGYNYCTTMYKNQILPNCDDYDADSHYIAQILLHKFPAGKFAPLRVPRTRQELEDMRMHRGIYKDMAMLITFEAYDVHAKIDDVAFLPIYNKNYHDMELCDRRSMVTHKLHDREHVKMTLTDVDFYLMLKYYRIGKIKISCVLGTEYGVLPDYVVNTCVELYQKKRSAKEELKRIKAMREPTAEEQAAYDLIKSYLNRIYGIFVQDPVRTNYIFTDGTVKIDKANRIRTKKVRFAPVLYQWGVWVASWARYELLTLFGALAVDPDGTYNYKILYCDTDSIKGFDLDTTIIAQYNAKVKERVRSFCSRKRIDFDTLDGLGEFKGEHYDYFKTIGQKRYCYVTPNGDFVYHISGLARPHWDEEKQKEVSFFDKYDTIAEKMDALHQDMVIKADESGLMESIYGGEMDPVTVEDFNGDTTEIKILSYVLLQPKGYKEGDDLLDMLREVEPERLDLMLDKFGVPAGGNYTY